jgi:hypothetical protein
VSLAKELHALADLLTVAANNIDKGIEAGFADEADQNPQAKAMARVAKRCRIQAAELRVMGAAGARQQERGNANTGAAS